MTAHDFDAMKHELAELRAKVVAYDEQKNADDKAAEQLKEYRNFLENMTDRAIKTFGLVIAITAGALTVIGTKSFIEITDKAQSAAQGRVQAYLSDHSIDSMIQERITEYQRAATIQYYLTQASSSTPARIPPDRVLEKVLESTLTAAHRKYVGDCANIIGGYDYFSKDPELAKRFGDLLLKLLTDSYGPDSIMLEDGAQTSIVATLGKLGRKDAAPALWKIFKDDRASDSYRIAFAQNLRSLLSSEDLFRQIVSDMPRARDQKGNVYAAELVAVLLAKPDDKAGLQELQSLAKEQGSAHSVALITVIDEVFLHEEHGFESNASDESVDFIAKNFFYSLVLSGRLYFKVNYYDDADFQRMRMMARFPGRRTRYVPTMPQVQLDAWIRTSESGGANGFPATESFMASSFLAGLLKNGLTDANTTNRTKVVSSVLAPLAGYLTDVKKVGRSGYDVRAIYGELSVNSDLQVPEATGQKVSRITVSEISKDGATIDLLAYPEQGKTPVLIKRKTSDLDLSKISFTPGLEDQF